MCGHRTFFPVNGSVKSQKFVETLSERLLSLLCNFGNEPCILQQDNARKDEKTKCFYRNEGFYEPHLIYFMYFVLFDLVCFKNVFEGLSCFNFQTVDFAANFLTRERSTRYSVRLAE